MHSLRSVFFVCVILLIDTRVQSKTPLIKNVFQGGTHLEGPHFAFDESALYWVDMIQQKTHRLDIDTGNITSRSIGYGLVSFIVRVKDYAKLVVISSRAELYLMSWDAPEGDQSLRLLSVVDVGMPNNACNDGKVDAKGRLWFGTRGKVVNDMFDSDQGALYLLTEYTNKHPEQKVRPVTLSNGIAWTSDNKTMFYTDSTTKNVDMFDYNLETGEIRNRKTLFSFQENDIPGIPDGMTIDRNENLWVACYNGGMIIKIDTRTGELMEQYRMPVTKVTSLVWGGYDYSTLYVTTSKFGLSPEQRIQEPEAGSLFAIDYTGSRGYPENQFVFANADLY